MESAFINKQVITLFCSTKYVIMDFYLNQHMSVPLSPDFTTVENVLPEIKPLEQEELMISTD